MQNGTSIVDEVGLQSSEVVRECVCSEPCDLLAPDCRVGVVHVDEGIGGVAISMQAVGVTHLRGDSLSIQLGFSDRMFLIGRCHHRSSTCCSIGIVKWIVRLKHDALFVYLVTCGDVSSDTIELILAQVVSVSIQIQAESPLLYQCSHISHVHFIDGVMTHNYQPVIRRDC